MLSETLLHHNQRCSFVKPLCVTAFSQVESSAETCLMIFNHETSHHSSIAAYCIIINFLWNHVSSKTYASFCEICDFSWISTNRVPFVKIYKLSSHILMHTLYLLCLWLQYKAKILLCSILFLLKKPANCECTTAYVIVGNW